jgi:hypothetical protein
VIPPPSPWKAFGEPEAEHEYLVMLTHLPVRRLSVLPKTLSEFRTWRWSAAGSALPPRWDDALERHRRSPA